MKLIKNISIIIFILLTSCNPKDCFQSAGMIVQQEVQVADFTKIEVGDEVSLILKQGTIQTVIIETGKNLIDDVNVEVINGKLFMEDNNSCNITREFGITKIIVTAPNITEIRSNTSRTISSEGVLSYNNLTIKSEDSNEDFIVISDFDLTLNTESFSVVANGNSVFKIRGNTTNLNVGFFAGSSRFEGKNLIANNINITQKSTNDILVNPVSKIEGTIFSIGDVISYNHPTIVNVTQLYTGELIFN